MWDSDGFNQTQTGGNELMDILYLLAGIAILSLIPTQKTKRGKLSFLAIGTALMVSAVILTLFSRR
jgi:hypothetical protein